MVKTDISGEDREVGRMAIAPKSLTKLDAQGEESMG